MDEYLGLLAAYDVVHSLVPDTKLRAAIKSQVEAIGNYLAEHSYLLVRPCGGFASRGAAGALPALSFPMNRVFGRITGSTFGFRRSFEDALRKAGIWPCLESPLNRLAALGITSGAAVGFFAGQIVAGALAPFGIFRLVGGLASGFLGARVGFTVSRCLGLLLHADCFDVDNNEGGQQEFALAYLLHSLTPKLRFQTWMTGLRMGIGGHAQGFAPLIGLISIQDGSAYSAIRDEYLAWYSAVQGKDYRGGWIRSGLSTAVAVVLGLQSEEGNLGRFLSDTYRHFFDLSTQDGRNYAGTPAAGLLTRRFDAPLVDLDDSHLVREESWGWRRGDPGRAEVLNPLEFLVCMALSWLHVRRLQDAGRPAPPGLPAPPPPRIMADWRPPAVPASVIQGAIVPALALNQPLTHVPGQPKDAQLFPDSDTGSVPPAYAKPDEAEPAIPPVKNWEKHTIAIPESSTLVTTGITLHRYDRYSLTPLDDPALKDPNLTIYAGVWATGRNGPRGWSHIDTDPKFPRPGDHPYCLLYALQQMNETPVFVPFVGWLKIRLHSSWQPVGSGVSYMQEGDDVEIIFRTNDDSPGNGDGQFTCDVRVGRV